MLDSCIFQNSDKRGAHVSPNKKLPMVSYQVFMLSLILLPFAAQAGFEFKNDTCTLAINGQAKFDYFYIDGGEVASTNKKTDHALWFLDLKTGLNCKLNEHLELQTMIRERPLKGSHFDWQGLDIGSREAWIGLAHQNWGSIRWGRFLTQLNRLPDTYAGPAAYPQTTDYGSAPMPITRQASFRYLSPLIFNFEGGITVGGKSDNQDIELSGIYHWGKMHFDGVYSQSVMNGAYFQANQNKPLNIGNKELVNETIFGGARYDFDNGARLRGAFKSNIFSLPSNTSGYYDLNGQFKTVTKFYQWMVSGTYPLTSQFTLGGNFMRYLDSSSRQIKFNDGASIASLQLAYKPIDSIILSLTYRRLKLDQKGAIPGSSTGVNQAIPDSVDNGRGLADHRWVFEQGNYGTPNFDSPKVEYVGIGIEYNF
jgi:hypothetical protein